MGMRNQLTIYSRWAILASSVLLASCGSGPKDNVGTVNDPLTQTTLSSAPTQTTTNNPPTQTTTNNPPTLTGTPPIVALTNEAYYFPLTANDPDIGVDPNEALTIAQTGLPTWASLDVSNTNPPGVSISGTPDSSFDNTASSVTVTATDKAGAVATFTYTLYVIDGEIVYLTWDNPTTDASGSPLDPSTLQGYTVSYSKDGGTDITDSVAVAGGANNWESPPLQFGSYTFTVTIYDNTGTSAPSNTASVDFQ